MNILYKYCSALSCLHSSNTGDILVLDDMLDDILARYQGEISTSKHQLGEVAHDRVGLLKQM
jgi:hypothetical protein